MDIPKPRLSASHTVNLFQYQLPENLKQKYQAPDNVIPFVDRGFKNLTFLTTLELIICIPLVPLRLGIALVFFLFLQIFTRLAAIGLKCDSSFKKLNIFQKFCLAVGFFAARGIFLMLGCIWVKVKGKPAKVNKVPIHLYCNHSTLADAVVLCDINKCYKYSNKVSPISKATNQKLANLLSLSPVLIDRASTADKHAARDAIQERVEYLMSNDVDECHKLPLVLFPEGTVNNGECFTKFGLGAFFPGVPVQPVYSQNLKKNLSLYLKIKNWFHFVLFQLST